MAPRAMYMPMPVRALSAGLVALAAASLLLALFLSRSGGTSVEERQNPGTQAAIGRPLVIKGFSWQSVDDYGHKRLLEADELEIRPRRLMAFNLKSLNEAFMRNAYLRVYSHGHSAPESHLFDLDDVVPLPGSRAGDPGRRRTLGAVTRTVFETVRMDVYHEERRIMTLGAARGLVDKNKSVVHYSNASLQDLRSGRSLKAGKILWDGKSEVFRIPGRFLMRDQSGVHPGSAVEIDLEFTQAAYGDQR